MIFTSDDRGHNTLFPEGLTLAQLAQFNDIIDVRSPSEFRDDHLPGAVNFPVLNDEERARVGTIYKQVSAFDAKKIGAALVARNIADHLERHFSDQPKNWRPLVYCWRGGSRSGAMTHILNQIGWRAQQLKGGYKAYRTMVLATLQTLPGRFRYRVICGPTGSGKSRLLAALDELGAQVLDLEGLAAHRGSILGNLPDTDQPSQKLFDSRLWQALQKFDPLHPVYVEAESKKIGNIRAPDALLEEMWQHGQCVRVEMAQEQRIALLKEEYVHFLENPAALNEKLGCLTDLHGRGVIQKWQALSTGRAWDELVGELLAKHYDPAYNKSTAKHYAHFGEALILHPADIGMESFREAAKKVMFE
ncbi:MAG: tRNA 2-selenouridine(34) synthase MnmH [Betaproteobacteria bacterium CG2_30_59_46]|nr:MAG: tRNA 2-selenouridine(34) synthase MnmH [Betaproteobacteria bacterium CG2_30_59_46]PIQ13672.1 MAG: tRNA 2-selenouridine(34) synthase MnmH [Hydrogenophilales bacterium CG18_big_fil_WC_8_21_14_2_50_58_12]PIX98960.1 MAG: tRNA 2-selenouridine(34) synthase MnmH [Hydrogenophilales bacterium CG_4_10_14_3_um_filter_58_23]PJB06261.1 MAG: tRNA 2-selenouridine(34) synthase MnmH [Hydrogenophilales bacterium CG_4_9_14_3_um_filter_59_35]